MRAYIVSGSTRPFIPDGGAPRHLRLFHRDEDKLTDIVLGADVIHVGGGNTANMLDVWHRHGARIYKPAMLLSRRSDRGAVLTGGSAGGTVLVGGRYHRFLWPDA